MVAKIMDAGRTVRSALDYNERKVANGDADLLASFNMDSSSDDPIKETFARYERINERSRNVSFHMSINPADGEELSDADAVLLAKDLMAGLGYSGQPMAIYRHHDIDRVHYHVVSIRTDGNGKKIRDYWEGRRCQKLLEDLAPDYGYVVGNGTAEELAELDIDPSRFHPEKGHVIAQMEAIFQECLGYHFTSFEQFGLIMEGHGIRMDEKTGENTIIILQGLDRKGKPCTAVVDEMATGIKMYEAYETRASECYSNRFVPEREKTRVAGLAAYMLPNAKSEDHFRNMMGKKGIDVHFYRTPDGAVSGVNFIDNQTKCAFKGSELSPRFTLAIYNDAARKWNADGSERTVAQVQENGHSGESLMNDIVTALTQGGGRSMERDMQDDREKRRRKRRMKI